MSTKAELLEEIAELESLINSNIPQEEKDFAKEELAEAQTKLNALEGSNVVVKEEKKAEEIIEKPISEIKTEAQAEKHIEKLVEIVENDNVSKEVQLDATEKILETEIKLAKIEEPSTKKVSAKAQKLMNEISENQSLIDSDIPQEEKDFAKEENISLTAELAVLEEEEIIEEPKVAKKGRGRPRVIKTDIETKIKRPRGRPRVIKADINAPRVKKKLGRPFTKKAEISADITQRKIKQKEKSLPMFDALRINKLLAKATGREFNNRGIKFGHAGTDGKYSIYIVSEKQISKAFQIYSEIADAHDVKVKRSETITKF